MAPFISRRTGPPPPKKYRSMADIMARAAPAVIVDDSNDDVDNITCIRCGLGDREDELLLCDKCDRGYHMDCVRPVVVRIPAGSWFCPDCAVRPRPKNSSQKKVERRCRSSSSASSHGV